MIFSALHRELGRRPGPFTIDMIDQAIEEGVEERNDLDWKQELIEQKKLKGEEFVKDVAAMANNGGGLIVYGVEEREKAAIARHDAPGFGELYERSLIAATIHHIHPPVFGVEVFPLQDEQGQALVVSVPASADRPHLVYRGERFGVPLRVGADTTWLGEREISRMYRERFNEQRFADEALQSLYDQADLQRDDERTWFIGVARPRTPVLGNRMSDTGIVAMLQDAYTESRRVKRDDIYGPIRNVRYVNPRPGLRSWVLTSSGNDDDPFTAQVTLHHDGAVSIAMALGGVHAYENNSGPTSVSSIFLESYLTDLVVLARVVGEATGTGEYEVRVGLESRDPSPIMMWTPGAAGYFTEQPRVPLKKFIPVTTSIGVRESLDSVLDVLRSIALDCVNQGGLSHLRALRKELA